MNIFGIGLPEMAVIAAIGLLVFGPKRLPELGRTLGRTIKGFQSASQEFEKEFRGAIAATSDPVLADPDPGPVAMAEATADPLTTAGSGVPELAAGQPAGAAPAAEVGVSVRSASPPG